MITPENLYTPNICVARRLFRRFRIGIAIPIRRQFCFFGENLVQWRLHHDGAFRTAAVATAIELPATGKELSDELRMGSKTLKVASLSKGLFCYGWAASRKITPWP